MSVVIQAENISKKYTLGTIGSGTLFRDLNMQWAKLRGKPNPYAKLGESGEFTEGEHWALKDVSFEIKQGDAVGIIGRNGAGKSTLLKILSRVTTPTNGSIKVKGRLASLLEVGTGFHPELSGRENIYMNGAILGMRKHEITRRLDEIIAFAGIEKYIDTPVKRYSSGMYVRLAFAVAAHLESEILIVDEVLAVGDAEFQKKCLGKMGDVSKNEGRTVLFVSHNMGTILQLCSKTILLKNGFLDFTGSSKLAVDKYFTNQDNLLNINLKTENPIYLKEISTVNSKNEFTSNFSFNQEIRLRLKIGINKIESYHNIGVCLLRNDKKRVFTVNKNFSEFNVKNENEIIVDFIIDEKMIAPMEYSFLVALNNRTGTITYEYLEDICPIKVFDDGSTGFSFAEGMDYGCIIVKDQWDIINRQ